MKKFRLLLLSLALSAAACAGGSSRYGCPVKSGHSCKSVREVYAETTSGGGSARDPVHLPRGKKKSARGRDAGKKLPRGKGFRAGRDARRRAGGVETPGVRAGGEKVMPVYIPPRVIRILIAPWQDSSGVFHSEKYVYVLSGGGRWTIGGKAVPLSAPEQGYPADIRLRSAGSAP